MSRIYGILWKAIPILFSLSLLLFISPIYGQTESNDGGDSSVEGERRVSKEGTVIPIEGEIDKFQVIFLRRSIEKAKDAGSDTIVFSINTFGGRVDSALQMATLIGSLEAIHTVAYIPADPETIGVSWSAGALISFSCNAIFMAPGTSIGAAAPVFQTAEGTESAGEKTVSAVRTQLAALAEKNGYPKEVAIAMVDKDVELTVVRKEDDSYRFKITQGTKEESTKEVSEEDGNEVEPSMVSPKGKLLTLTAGEMENYGISSGTPSNLSALLSHLEITNPLRINPSGADRIVGYLTSAAITSLLLTVGLLALYLEITSPGFGLPGTVAVLAFALIFFSGGLQGTLGSLELLLFLFGVVLLVVEIFLIPGFGVAGIGGLLFMGVGLILSRQGFILPETTWQWDLFFQNLAVVFGTFALSFILMGLLMMVFPKIRLFRRLILSTTSPGGTLHEEPTQGKPEIGTDPAAGSVAGPTTDPAVGTGPAVGSVGRVKTTLRPAGRVEIGGENYSVLTEGEWIEADEEVQVTEVAGNRIVVERSG